MKAFVLLIVAAVCFPPAAQAQTAGPFEAGFYTGATWMRFVGNIRHLEVDMHAQPAIMGRAELSWLFGGNKAVTFSISDAEPRISLIENKVRYVGGKMQIRPLSARFEYRFNRDSPWQPLLGAGIVYYWIGGKHVASSPSASGVSLHTPDHGATVVVAGLSRSLGSGWGLRAFAEYGPASSTAETFTQTKPLDALEADFHPLTVSFGITKRF
jgi:outer membrane protein W